MSAELSVELSLQSKKAVAQAKAAAAKISAEMASNLGNFEFPSDRKRRELRQKILKQEEKEQAAKEMREYARYDNFVNRGYAVQAKAQYKLFLEQQKNQNKLAKDAVKQAMDASRINIAQKNKEAKDAERQSLNASRINISRQRQQAKAQEIYSNRWKNVALGVGSAFSSPWISARFFSDAAKGFGKGGGGGNGLTGGLFGAGGTAAFGEFYIAVTLATKAVKMMGQEMVKAADNARKLYAKSLIGGMPIGYTNQRQLQASVLGVSETEVVRFGKALQWINPQIAAAQAMIAKTAIPLATLGAEFEIVKIKVEAFAAKIMAQAKPAIEAIISVLSSFAEAIELLKIVEAVVWVFTKIAEVADLAVSGFKLFIYTVADGIALLIKYANNLFEILKHPFDKSKRKMFDTDFFSDETIKLSEEVNKKWAVLFGKRDSTVKDLPAPVSYMKQLGASSLERMGLVMGMGSANPAKETAQNTKKMVQQLQVIATKLATPYFSGAPFAVQSSYL